MSDLVYDKPQIIRIMRDIMRRLRQHRVFVVDILETMAQHDVQLSRARFDDMFLTRSARDVHIPLDIFHLFFTIVFDCDADIVRADEFLALINAARIPIHQLHRYQRYFSAQDWQSALHQYGLRTRPVTPQLPMLIGRDTILNRLYALMTKQRHMLLAGPAGIGKTAIALELLRRYEMSHGQPLYYLDVRSIRTLAQLYEHLAALFHVKPIANEPILLRLQMVLHRTLVYVILEHIDECDSGISARVIVTQLQAHLPMLRCVAIARTSGLLASMSEFHEEIIPALDTAHSRASACQLFMQMYHQAGGHNVNAEYVLTSCRAVHGNPLAISMIANAMAGTADVQVTDEVVHKNIAQLDAIDTQIVTLLCKSTTPLTRRFLCLIAPAIWGMHAPACIHRIEQLIQRRIVYVVGSDEQMRIEVNAVIRQVMMHHDATHETQQLFQHVASAIHQLDLRWEVTTDHATDRCETSDLWCVLGCTAVMLTYHMYAETAQILVMGRSQWIRHGLSDGATPQVEECVSALPATQPLVPELLFTLGSLYSARGMISLALTYLRRAYAGAQYRNQQPLMCRIAAEIGMNGVIDTSEPPLIAYDTICTYLDGALHFLHTHDDIVLRASVLDLYAYVCLSAGDSARAIAYNDQALRFYTQCKSAHGIVEANFNRGLIYLALGAFDIAQPALVYARAEYARLRIGIGEAQCNLRLAAIAVLGGAVTQARALLADAIEPLHRAGGLQDMLYVMDIYSGILLLQGAFHDTIQLCDRIEHFRAERHIYRGKQLDAIFQQQRHIAHQQIVATPLVTPHPMAHLTFYDVIRLIRDDLCTQ